MREDFVVRLILSAAPLAPVALMIFLYLTSKRDYEFQFGMIVFSIIFWIMAVVGLWN